MNQKATVILVAILLLGGIAGGVSFFGESSTAPATAPESNPLTTDSLFTKQDVNALGAASSPTALSGSNGAPAINPGTSQPSPSPAVSARKKYNSFPGVISAGQLANKKAVIETDKGVIEFEIFPESPKAASNFIFLSQEGFYNGLTFHRIVPNFVIQGGDPNGDGSGDPGYLFEDEPVTKPYLRGTVAMAKRADPNTNGSQFFIVLTDNPPLEPKYTIFGMVTKGMEVLAKIQQGDVMKKVTITGS